MIGGGLFYVAAGKTNLNRHDGCRTDEILRQSIEFDVMLQKRMGITSFLQGESAMMQSDDRPAKVRWNLSVPPDLDEAARLYLASQGGKKGSLSALVRKAVSCYILSSLTSEAKEKVRSSGLSQEELDNLIADAIVWAKAQPR